MSKIFISLVIFALAFSVSSCKKRIRTDGMMTCQEVTEQLRQVSAIRNPEPAIEERKWNLRDLFVSKCQNQQQ